MDGYGRVYQQITRDKSLTIEAKGIYAYLASMAGADGECFPNTALMCEELGISGNRLYKHMKVLEMRGAVERIYRREDSTHVKTIYRLATAPCNDQAPKRQNDVLLSVEIPQKTQSDGSTDEMKKLQNDVSEETPSEKTSKRRFEAIKSNSIALKNNREIKSNKDNIHTINAEDQKIRCIANLKNILDTGRGKAYLKIDVGMRLYDSFINPGFSWDDLEREAREFVQVEKDRDRITWLNFREYLDCKRSGRRYGRIY